MKNITILVLVVLVIALAGYVIRKDRLGVNPKESTTINNVGVPTGKVLDLSGQGLTKAPEAIFSRTDLEELNLSNNVLSGALQSQIGNLHDLKVLNLSNNKFTGVPAEIGQLKNLEVLNLSNNLITGLPNELGNLSKLKMLDLSGNKYSESDLATIRKNLPSSVIIKTQ